MRSTMQEVPLSVSRILTHGVRAHPGARVITATVDGVRTVSFAELGDRVARLAGALRSLGVEGDQRVATFQWNNQEHLEAYLAVPAMGAVLHPLNLRLAADQVGWIARHAEDRVVIVDASLAQLFTAVLPELGTVRHVVVAGPEAAGADLSAFARDGVAVHRYEDLLAAAEPLTVWPDVAETDAAAMCYTSGTTGDPKGVAYSHRSITLHSMAVSMGGVLGISDREVVLPVVPMFHAGAWGLPYASVMSGADLVLPDRWLQAERLVALMERTRPTVSGGVPTIWNDILNHIDSHPADLSSLRIVLCGGSAVPLSLQRALQDRHGIPLRQAWGMTETSPVAALVAVPEGSTEEEAWRLRAKQGQVLPLVEARIVDDDGNVLPQDGAAVGELQVRGPWVTGSYYLDEGSASAEGGWLRTGDVGCLDERGYIVLTDRAKDVIKSGGEWISSVELENAIMAHPAVLEAAVVGIPDERWQERPLAMVVLRDGRSVTAGELRSFVADGRATWQLPDAWTFATAVPKTSVGKFDKKAVRGAYADGLLEVQHT